MYEEMIERGKIMNSVLDFKDYDSWMPNLNPIIDKYDINPLVDKFKESTHCLEFYNIEELLGEEILNELQSFLLNEYKFIVFYHATATNNIESFYNNGFLVMNIERQNKFLRDIFNQNDFPEITDEKFDNICKKVKDEILGESGIGLRKNKIFFCLDDQHLIDNESANHYLVYGSEYNLIFAQHLSTNWRDYPEYLEEKLKSTLFKCKIPTKLILEEDLKSCFDAIIVRYFENIIYPDDFKYDIWSCIEIYENLNPSYIISHTHPKNLRCNLKKSMYGYY